MPSSEVIYVGETIYLKASAVDPTTNQQIVQQWSGADWSVSIYFSPKDPSVNVSDRTADRTFNTPSVINQDGSVIFEVSTVSFPAGVTWWQATISGGTNNYDAWGYSKFTLTA